MTDHTPYVGSITREDIEWMAKQTPEYVTHREVLARRGVEGDTLAEALESARTVLATMPDDTIADRRLAWLWGIFVGWDEAALAECVRRHGWRPETLARLRGYRAAVRLRTMQEAP